MRLTATLPFAAVAAAIVIPDTKDPNAWADFLPSRENVEDSIDSFVSKLKKDFDSFTTNVEDVISSAGESLTSTLQSVLSDDELNPLGGRDHHRKHENQTIYEIIKESEHTSKFAAIVDEHESVVKLLNSTKANYTLFVPINEAFEHIPDHPDHKPSKEFVEALLKYHIGAGLYPAGRILLTHTLPTTLEEAWLYDEPQRLRTRVGLGGVSVNFYDKIIAANFFAKNGVIHGVRHILVPPPGVPKILSLFPSKFSTLLLGAEKSHFTEYIKNLGYKLKGITVFAPSNTAFERLGPGANAFLFNTEKGLKYLKALLKYHVVANQTLYSDAFYKGKDDGKGTEEVKLWNDDEPVEEQGLKHYHVDLPSLLGERNIAVDTTRWGGFIDVKVNGYIHVAIQDVVTKNGVIHVVDNVLLPHRAPGDHGPHHPGSGEVSVEDLVEILEPYVDEEEKEESEWTDL